MLIDRGGREYAKVLFTTNVVLTDPEVLIDGTWNPASVVNGEVIFLVAGPDADVQSNPAGTIVLPDSRAYDINVRFQGGSEIIIRPAGRITVAPSIAP